MNRQGPRYRGGAPPGRYGGGNSRREMPRMDGDIDEDPMDVYGRLEDHPAPNPREGMGPGRRSSQGGHWEDHPVPNPREEGMGSSRRSTRSGPQSRRGAGYRDMNDLTYDMDSSPSDGGRHARGRGASHTDDIESYHACEHNAVSMRDLPMLKESRRYMMEKLRRLGGPGTGEERRMLRDNLSIINGDIAQLEAQQREGGGGMPHGMKGPMDSMRDNPRQSFPSGRVDTMIDREVGSIGEDIDRLELGRGEGSRMSRGMGGPARRGERGDYSDEESEYQPHGARRGQYESTAGHGRYSRHSRR